MDSDSDIPLALIFGLIFMGSLLLYGLLAFLQHAIRGVAAPTNGMSTFQRFGLALSPYRYAGIIALSLSGLLLALSLQPLAWWSITLTAVIVLVLVSGFDRAAYYLVARFPTWSSRYSAPALRILVRNWGLRRSELLLAEPALSQNGQSGFAVSPEGAEPVITEEELVNLDDKDREMLRSILRLDVSTAREIMVPRLDMVAVELNTPLEQVAEKFIQSGHSRLPVYEDTIDQIAGVVYSRDLLALLVERKADAALSEVIRPAFFIPESKRLDGLLQEMQQKALQFAIVVDEYGGTEGLVTMEDLLEEIVGEIEDEFSKSEDPITRLDDGAAIIDAGVTTEDVEELFGAKLQDPDVDTVGGYVYRTLGRMPQVGDKITVDRLSIEVISVLGRRLRKLRVEPIQEVSAS